MGISINFNTITFYTAMSKNTELDKLNHELAELPQALNEAREALEDDAVILARVVKGLSSEGWRDICQAHSLERWHAFPIPAAILNNATMDASGMGERDSLVVSPFREVAGALTTGTFAALLKRELSRLGRNGGCLSLLGAGLARRGEVVAALGEKATARLESLLGVTILKLLEDCDSLCAMANGQYISCMPGMGQLAARNLAEKIQGEFEEAAKPYFPAGGISAGANPGCALGIVNLLQGENGKPDALIKRARISLDLAMGMPRGHIHQETTFTPLENTTLVQSSEKRFLFFGGDTK